MIGTIPVRGSIKCDWRVDMGLARAATLMNHANTTGPELT